MSGPLSGSEDASDDPQTPARWDDSRASHAEVHQDPVVLRRRLEQQRKAREQDAQMQRDRDAAVRGQAEREQAERAASKRRTAASVSSRANH
jgi:hypothetical protein